MEICLRWWNVSSDSACEFYMFENHSRAAWRVSELLDGSCFSNKFLFTSNITFGLKQIILKNTGIHLLQIPSHLLSHGFWLCGKVVHEVTMVGPFHANSKWIYQYDLSSMVPLLKRYHHFFIKIFWNMRPVE